MKPDYSSIKDRVNFLAGKIEDEKIKDCIITVTTGTNYSNVRLTKDDLLLSLELVPLIK